jgi:uncharacterized repeat protein (TIGR01451 family)
MNRPAFLSWPAVRLLALAAPVAAGLAMAAAPPLATPPAATTFTYTGAEQTDPVPTGTTAVTITAVGARGGTAQAGGGAGGNGVSVTATVPLPAGTTTLYVEVGGPGATALGPTAAGFNGGDSSESGGTRGGASDVRTCSISTCTNLSANDTRLVVAGDGGGSSFWVPGATGTSMSQDTTGTADVQITPVTGPDLALTDTAPPTAVSGEPYQYTLTATSTGGQDATGVSVTDTLPATAHFDTASVTAGKCTHTPSTAPATNGGTVSCTAASLTAGASMTVTIKVTATTLGTVSDAAKATASNVTADTDDSGTASTTVHGTWQ